MVTFDRNWIRSRFTSVYIRERVNTVRIRVRRRVMASNVRVRVRVWAEAIEVIMAN